MPRTQDRPADTGPVHAPRRAGTRRPDRLVAVALPVAGLAAAGPAAGAAAPGSAAARAGAVVVAIAAAVAVSRRGRLPEACVAFLAGLAALTVGIAVGAGRAAHGHVDAAGLAALVDLAAGAVLAVRGPAALLRGRRMLARVGGAVAGLLVAFAVVVPAWPAVYATNPPHADAGRASPADEGLTFRDVRCPAERGISLAAWYLPASRDGAAVVLRHGAGETRADVLAHGAVLHRNGFGVLLVDARGHGDSGGRAMDFGWYGDADVRAAVTCLIAQPGVDPARVGVVGPSMGGEEALGAAAADRRIRAVVAEGATGRVAGDLGWLGERYGVRGEITAAWRRAITFPLADLLTPADPPLALRDAVARARRPVLLVTAGNRADEAAAARHIRAAAPALVTVWEVPGAGHTAGLTTDRDAWTARVAGFLRANLPPA